MSISETVKKFDDIFKLAPWLIDSKNIIHFKFVDENAIDEKTGKKKPKELHGVSWAEIWELIKDYKEVSYNHG